MPTSRKKIKSLKIISSQGNQICQKILRVLIYLTIFLIPLFFLPWTTDRWEFNKITLFMVLMVASFTVWLVEIIIKRELKIVFSRLEMMLLIFVVIYILATIFSKIPYLSLVGQAGNYGESLISLILLVIFYFLLRQVFNQDRNKILTAIYVLLISGGVIAIGHFFQIFGLFGLPFDFAQYNSFNVVANSVSIFAIFLAILIPFSMGYAIIFANKKIIRVLIISIGVVAFLLLICLDQNIGWYCLLGGMFIMLIFIASSSQKIASHWIIWPTLLLILSAFFWVFPISNFIDFGLPLETRLDQSTSWQIVGHSLSEFKFFGSGPQTFVYEFIKYQPANFNDSIFWNLKFSKASSQWWQQITTIGLLGTLVFLIINLWFMIMAFKAILKFDKKNNFWFLKLSLGASFLMLLIASFFLSFNFILFFFWWTFLALGLTLYQDRAKQELNISLVKRPQIHLAVSAFFAIWCLAAIWLVYAGAKIWLADHYLNQSARTITMTEDIIEIQSNLERSISLNPRLGTPYFALARNLATQAKLASLSKETSSNNSQELVKQAVADIEKGITMEPDYSGTYENAALVYQSLLNLADYQERIIELNKKALDLEPNNAWYYLNLGNSQLDYANNLSSKQDNQSLSVELINQAINNYSRASVLKSNYTEAEIAWSWALLFTGQQEQGLEKMKVIIQNNPQDLTVLYEAGELTLRANILDQAEQYFQAVIKINPSHSNSHYQLSKIYKQQGKNDLAIKELEIVIHLNPDNETITKELNDLKALLTNGEVENKDLEE